MRDQDEWMNALLMDEAHVCKFLFWATVLIQKSYVDEEGVKGLTGATRWSTCHTRGSPRPAVRSGLERYLEIEMGEQRKAGQEVHGGLS